MRFNKYKFNLFLNIFPSYSISALVTNIFVQPRIFGLPFLLDKSFKFKINIFNLFLILNFLICFFIPLIGPFFERRFYYLDFAYFLSSLYTLFFVNIVIKNEKNIDKFNTFVKLSLLINFWYILLQLFFYYIGLSQFTMIHSNIPFHVDSGYVIEPGLISFIPRYTGLWIESGPLTFYLCLTFPYILQKGNIFPKYLIYLSFILIFFSQSKFLLIFLPTIFFEILLIKFSPSLYKMILKPWNFFLLITIFLLLILTLIFGDFEFHSVFSTEIPSYALRLHGLRESLNSFSDFGFFGKGLLPSTIELNDVKFALEGSDAFSIVFLGFGFYPGLILLLTILLIPVFSFMNYKITFCSVLIFGFLSSGSLIVPQYLFAVTYAIVAHYQNKKYVVT